MKIIRNFMKKWIKFSLIGIITIPLLFFILIILTLMSINRDIKKVETQFINETGQNLELNVYFLSDFHSENRKFSEKKYFDLAKDETYTKTRISIPECINIIYVESGKEQLINAFDIVNMINPEWHEMPTIAEYRFTNDLSDSEYCKNKYSE